MIPRFNRRPLAFALAALAGTASLAALAPAAVAGHHGSHMAAAATVVDIAVGSPDHKTLVAAVQAAGLVETLQRDYRVTVAGPTTMLSKSSETST